MTSQKLDLQTKVTVFMFLKKKERRKCHLVNIKSISMLLQIDGKRRLVMLFFDDSIVPKNCLNSYVFDQMFNLECFVGYSKSISNNGVGVIFGLALFHDLNKSHSFRI